MRERLLLGIQRFRQLYRKMFAQKAGEYGLNQLEVDVLLCLYNNPAHNTVGDIAALRGFAKSNVSNAAESLRKKGYLSINPDGKNRRKNRLCINQPMQERVDALLDCQHRCIALLLRGFSEGEREGFLRLLVRMDENVMEALGSVSGDAGNPE